jgi:hypothetical protein
LLGSQPPLQLRHTVLKRGIRGSRQLLRLSAFLFQPSGEAPRCDEGFQGQIPACSSEFGRAKLPEVFLLVRNSEARPCLFQELALVSAACQAQEANLFSADQLGFGGNLKADSGGSGLLRCHPIAAAVGLLFVVFLSGGDKIVLLGNRGRRGSGLLGTVRRGAGRACDGGLDLASS